MSSVRSRSNSGSSNASMPLLNKEVEDFPEDGSSDLGSSMSSEYRFGLQLMNDDSPNDTPPPISPNSTAFDTDLSRGQVKIIRTGDTMHVLTYEEGGKPMITSYAKPLSSTWREPSPRPRMDLSPIRPPFKFDGETALRTVTRYCFPSCSDSDADTVALEDILQESQHLAEKWLNSGNCDLTEGHRAFLKNRFLHTSLDSVVSADWEKLVELLEAHQQWKMEQSLCEEPPSHTTEVSLKQSRVKILPQCNEFPRKRKNDLNFDELTEIDEKLDMPRNNRGDVCTFVVNPDKNKTLATEPVLYKVAPSKRKGNVSKVPRNPKASPNTSPQAKVARKKAIKANRLLKNAKSDKSSEKLNPRRDKPMAKIRSQVRKVDRFARMNGESFHNAALTLSRNQGLASSSKKIAVPAVAGRAVNSCPQETEQMLVIREKDLDLGLEGVCFDVDVAELADSMVDTDLEDLDGLVRDPPDSLNFSSQSESTGGNSMVEALHAGINSTSDSEFSDGPLLEKSFHDMDNMDDGLLAALDNTLGEDIDVTNLMGPEATNPKEEIFLMTSFSAAEHSAFETLGQQLIEQSPSPDNKKTETAPPLPISHKEESIVKKSDASTDADSKPSDSSTSGNEFISHSFDETPKEESIKEESEVNVSRDTDSQSAATDAPIINESPAPVQDIVSANDENNSTPVNNNNDSVNADIKTELEDEEDPAPVSTTESTDLFVPLSPKPEPEDEDVSSSSPVPEEEAKKTHRKSAPARFNSSRKADRSNKRTRSPSHRSSSPESAYKKAKTLLQCTLTGSYWQIPENKFPCNRPKRANAGALMTTKLRNKGRNHANGEGRKRAARVNSRTWSGVTNKNSKYKITPDDMLISKKTALRCSVSIPDSLCPTSHEEFLYKHRRYFGEDDLTELQELINRFRPVMEVSGRTTAIDRYLNKLGKKSKKVAEPPECIVQAPSPETVSTVIKTEEIVAEPKQESPVQAPPSQATTATKPKGQNSNKPHQTLPHSNVPKPKSYARYKKFEEDERTEVLKLDNKQILADGQIFDVDYENYLKEKDVEFPYDDHQFLPPDSSENDISTNLKKCDNGNRLPYCLLGCVCESLCQGERESKHCGKLKCMLECNCNALCWNTEDADIRSRLRPRVSMLNWSSRLNYLDSFISPDRERDPVSKDAKAGDVRSAQTNGCGRIRRNIVPPKRNNDFISHSSPNKKFRDDGKSLTRQTKVPPFKAIGNRLRLKQRQQLLRPLKSAHNLKDEGILKLKLKKSIATRLKSDDSQMLMDESQEGAELKGVHRAAFCRMNLQRNSVHRSRVEALNSKKVLPSVDFQGTGPLIPAELMARFAPFMEIQYHPKEDKLLSIESESEDSTDDENEVNISSLLYKFSPKSCSSFAMHSEEPFPTPVIVSYRSCQEGLADVVYPTSKASVSEPSS